jgi:hypothetical protein
VIDNFAPQPYPLECSADGETWSLVIGWRRQEPAGELVPILALAEGGLTPAASAFERHYRLASAARPAAVAPRATASVARPSVRDEAAVRGDDVDDGRRVR